MTVGFLAAAKGVRQVGGTGLWLEAGSMSTKALKASSNCRPSGTSEEKSKFETRHDMSFTCLKVRGKLTLLAVWMQLLAAGLARGRFKRWFSFRWFNYI